MKITEDVRKYDAEQGIADEEALAEKAEGLWRRSGGLHEGVVPRGETRISNRNNL